jgi:hypothetical protein
MGPLTQKNNQPADWGYFVSNYCCDLSWAKNSQFCKSSRGGNTNTSTWDNYPCVVELAKSKGVSPDKNNAYTIGGFRYYSNGRKVNSKGEKYNFTCNDPEFKQSIGGGGNPPSSDVHSESNGIYTTKGDPYQYKVVGCVWYTKGKKITNWASLEGNQNATNILDGRFPGARKECKKTKVENKPENKDVVVGGGGEQKGQTKSGDLVTGVNQTQQGLTSQDIETMSVEDAVKMLPGTQPTPSGNVSSGGVTTNQQESVSFDKNIIKEDFYNTLKKIS